MVVVTQRSRNGTCVAVELDVSNERLRDRGRVRQQILTNTDKKEKTKFTIESKNKRHFRMLSNSEEESTFVAKEPSPPHPFSSSVSIGKEMMMSVLSNKISKDQLKPGDHIYSWRKAYVYAHHGSFSFSLSLSLSTFFSHELTRIICVFFYLKQLIEFMFVALIWPFCAHNQLMLHLFTRIESFHAFLT